MSRHLFWLSDEQWLWIEPHLPEDVRGRREIIWLLSAWPPRWYGGFNESGP
jgi:transposase